MKMSLKQWLEKAKNVHGEKYDYTHIINAYHLISDIKIKVNIICKIHKPFLQSTQKHLNGQGCYKCGRTKLNLSRMVFDDDIMKDAQDCLPTFHRVVGINENNAKSDRNMRMLDIDCQFHGKTTRQYDTILSGKGGCKYCAQEKRRNESKDRRNSLQEFLIAQI